MLTEFHYLDWIHSLESITDKQGLNLISCIRLVHSTAITQKHLENEKQTRLVSRVYYMRHLETGDSPRAYRLVSGH